MTETSDKETLEILQRVGVAVASELDLDRAVQVVTDAATEVSGAQFGAFFYNVTDDSGERYTLYAISGAPREAFSKFPMPLGASFKVVVRALKTTGGGPKAEANCVTRLSSDMRKC